MCADHAKSSADVFFNIRFKPDLHARLKTVAEKNERTLAAEVRVAVRDHLERLETEEAAA